MKKFIYNEKQGEYDHYRVKQEQQLLPFLLENIKGSSRTKIKATLKGGGIRVNRTTVTQFDYLLEPGMDVMVSKTNLDHEVLKSRYVKFVYEF